MNDAARLHQRARRKGVNPVVYWIVRAVLQPFFRVWFRLERHGREHLPQSGPLLLAANHRSFLDPFVLATMLRRPIYYVAKRELFRHRVCAWFLNSLGAFPVDRGGSDQEMLETARQILKRGDCVLIFPEGTRVRPGGLGTPKRGVGRLALEAGAPVVPLAVHGTEDIRKGWRIRPRKVTIRAGRPLTFPTVAQPSPGLAQAVTDRIWPCVALQWEWLGGLPPLRTAAVIGAGPHGRELASALASAGLDVQLGARTRARATALALSAPEHVTVKGAADLDLESADLVVLAVPARALPHVLAAHGHRVAAETGVVVTAKGLVPPLGALPTAFAAERVQARAVACLGGPTSSLTVGTKDAPFAAQLVRAFTEAGLDARHTDDVLGVELAGVAAGVAALAVATTGAAGPEAAGAAAGRVLEEVGAYARRLGAGPGLAAASDLAATLLAASGPQTARGRLDDARASLPALVERLGAERLPTRALTSLAELTAETAAA